MSRVSVTLLLASMLMLAGCDAFVNGEQRLARAQTAFDSGDAGRAMIELQKAIQREPENAAARVLLARLSLHLGNAGNAQLELDRAIRDGAKGEAVDRLRAEVLMAIRQPAALEQALRTRALVLAEPDRSVLLARALNALGRPDQALAVLERVMQSPSAPTSARVARAEALATRGESDQALSELDSALVADPASFDAPLLKGSLLARRGQVAQAEAALRLSLQRMSPRTPLPQRAHALTVLTEACLAQGKLAEASEVHRTLAQLAPDIRTTVLLGARIKLVRGDYSGGIADLQRLVAKAPDFVQARMMLGAAQLAQGHLLQAESQLSAVVQNASDNVEARKLLARVRLQLDQPEAALRALTPAVDADTADPQVYALLGSARLRSGNAGAAREALEQGVKANPADPELRLELARTYLAEGRSRDALQLLQEGSSVASVDLRRDMLFVAALNAERGPAAARAQIEKLLAARPNDVATLNVGAAFFAARWEFERAHNLLRQALTLDPRSVPTLFGLAQLDADTGDQAGAEATLRTALAAEPANVLARLALSDLLTRRGAYNDAKQVLVAGPGKAPAIELRLAMGQLHLVRADVGAAAAVFDGVIASLPDRPDIVNRVGLLLLEGRQFDLALVRFRRAAEMAPRNASYWVNAGRAQLALDQSVAASESFQKALAQQPNMVPAVAALALIDVRGKKYDAALARVRSLLSERPNDADVLLLEGDVLATSGAYRDAADAYAAAARQRPDAISAAKLHQARVVGGLPKPEEPLQQWLALQPADFRVRGILASYYLTQHDFKQAASECEQILQQSPSSVVALNNLAWVYSTLGDGRAESFAERAQRLAPDSAAVADTLGWILAKKRATDRALPLLEKAARGLPRDAEAQYHYAYVLAQAGRRDDARAVLSRALSAEGDFPARQDAERLLADLKV